VDSGSVGTFIGSEWVVKLKLTTASIPVSQYKAADRGLMTCKEQVQGLQWWCQGTSFCQDTKVLTIGGYDMVLGANWLEDQGAMWID
jgi:hypothetical protein